MSGCSQAVRKRQSTATLLLCRSGKMTSAAAHCLVALNRSGTRRSPPPFPLVIAIAERVCLKR